MQLRAWGKTGSWRQSLQPSAVRHPVSPITLRRLPIKFRSQPTERLFRSGTGASAAVDVSVADLQQLCRKSLLALGYSEDEALTLTDVSVYGGFCSLLHAR